MGFNSGLKGLIFVVETECLSREVDTECVHVTIRYGISSFLKERTQCSCMFCVAGRRGAVQQQSLRHFCCGKTCFWCRLLRCTSMPDPAVCWNWSIINGWSLVFDSSCTQLKTEIESHVSSRCSGRLLYTFSYAFFHFTMDKMPGNSNNSACLRYIDTAFEIGTNHCHLCRADLKNGRCESECKLPDFLSPFIFWKSNVCSVTFFLPSHSYWKRPTTELISVTLRFVYLRETSFTGILTLCGSF
jgi:hypothetical protein